MPKFYVACGSQTLVINAPSPELAAMRLIDEALAAHLWIYEDTKLTGQQRRDHIVLEALLHLGATISVSERGINASEAGQFELPGLLEQWHRLMTSLSRLFVAAGLAPQRVLPRVLESSFVPRAPR